MDEDNGPPEAVMFQSYASVPEACLKALVAVHEAFARELEMQLAAYLRANLSIKYVRSEEAAFSDFINARGTHRCGGPASFQPFDGQFLLDLDSPALFALLELMLGGKPATRVAPERGPTEIEKQLIGVVFRFMASGLETAWSTVTKTSVHFSGIEKASQIARTFSPSDLVIAAHFEIKTGDQSGLLTVITPAQVVSAALDAADRADAGVPDQPMESARVSSVMMQASVQVDVWLDGVSLQLRDLVQLREGYVIKFDHPTDRPLECTLNGETRFPGQVVSTGRKRAFLLSTP